MKFSIMILCIITLSVISATHLKLNNNIKENMERKRKSATRWKCSSHCDVLLASTGDHHECIQWNTLLTGVKVLGKTYKENAIITVKDATNKDKEVTIGRKIKDPSKNAFCEHCCKFDYDAFKKAGGNTESTIVQFCKVRDFKKTGYELSIKECEKQFKKLR